MRSYHHMSYWHIPFQKNIKHFCAISKGPFCFQTDDSMWDIGLNRFWTPIWNAWGHRFEKKMVPKNYPQWTFICGGLIPRGVLSSLNDGVCHGDGTFSRVRCFSPMLSATLAPLLLGTSFPSPIRANESLGEATRWRGRENFFRSERFFEVRFTWFYMQFAARHV